MLESFTFKSKEERVYVVSKIKPDNIIQVVVSRDREQTVWTNFSERELVQFIQLLEKMIKKDGRFIPDGD